MIALICQLLVVTYLLLPFCYGRRRGLASFTISDELKGLSFFHAASSNISYVGRWLLAGPQEPVVTAFAGAYFEFDVSNTSAVLLSLSNDDTAAFSELDFANASEVWRKRPAWQRHLTDPLTEEPAGTITLIAELGHQDLILLPSARGLVRISGSFSHETHHIRVIAPMLESHSHNVLQLNGIYVDRHGYVNGRTMPQPLFSLLEKTLKQNLKDVLQFETHSAPVGESDEQGSLQAENGLQPPQLFLPTIATTSRRLVEVITDSPGFFLSSDTNLTNTRPGELATAINAWEYQLGEMFSADHISTSAAGMCLSRKCKGGVHSPIGLADMYFRNGPPDSLYYPNMWDFSRYTPNVVILSLGHYDQASFLTHEMSYGQTIFELSADFERQYVTFVQAIRKFALSSSATSPTDSSNIPELIPIFIMRPLTGALEHATQNVVQALRDLGDPRVFWIDTTGWVAPPPATIDYAAHNYTDPYTRATQRIWTLNAQGNARVATFLHEHVCRFLAEDPASCNFLPPDVYEGAGYVESDQRLQRVFERERKEKLHEKFGVI